MSEAKLGDVVTEPKRGPGQPRIGSEHKITIPDEAWATLTAIAAEQKTSASALIRYAIADYIDRKGNA